MIATAKDGKLWRVDDGVMEPIGHSTDPDTLTRAEQDYLLAQLPRETKPDLGEDNWGWRYDAARDAYEERRCR